MTEPEKLDLRSLNPADEKVHLLQEAIANIMPEALSEGGKIDFDKLKLALGQSIDAGRERYGMTWPGKADCFKTIQTPSTGTLLPAPDESVNFDTTENLIIEGDNLNVLKLLQKAYLGKVKMIYIDPPYNTGNDFIYPDNYAESLQTYLEYTGQVDAEGRKFGTNTDIEGRFHSRWLSMMYPRLYLARNLLSEEGMIFISIDDNEVDNLLKLCDEIFGEENFVGLFVINSSPSAIDYGHIAKQHDYVVFYAKNLLEANTNQLIEKEKEFKYTDETGPFNIYPLYNGNVAFNPSNRPNLYYPFFLNPNNEIGEGFYEISLEKQEGWVEVFPVVSKKDGIQRIWRWGKEKSKNNLNKEIVGYKTEDGEYRVVQKSRHTGKVIRSIQSDQDISSRRGTAEVESIFGSKAFSFPKPTELVKKFINISMEDGDIALDFFAGSGTTAHAILDINKQDDRNFKFILVQLPESIENKDFRTIADITKERVRRVIKKLNSEESGQFQLGEKQDRGFRVFKLGESNFKGWEASAPKDGASLAKQLELHIDHIREGRTNEDILYEILLKSGFPLTTPVEKIEVEGKSAYSVAGGGMLICLEKDLTLETVRTMTELKPQRVICLDMSFAGNDQLKANAVQIFKTKDIVFKTV